MHILSWIVSVVMLFLPIGGCIREEDLGYPEKVYFSSEGGTQIIEGRVRIIPSIVAGNETVSSYYADDDSICVRHDWLQVIAYRPEAKIKITASPSNGEKRKLKIEGFTGREECHIMVNQSN